MRLRARDPAAGEQALAILRNPHSPPEQWHAAIGIPGTSAGLDATGAVALRAQLVSLRQQVRAFGIAFVNPRGLDRWIEAADLALVFALPPAAGCAPRSAVVRSSSTQVASVATPSIAVAVTNGRQRRRRVRSH